MENNNNETLVDAMKEADPVVVTADNVETAKKDPTPKEKLQALKDLRRKEGLSTSEELAFRRLSKNLKMQTRTGNGFRRMMDGYNKQRLTYHRRQETQIRVLADTIGKKNMKMLVDLFTVNVPEEKDKDGAVTQAAHSYVNYPALLAEGLNVIVMERQSRIDAGLRKKTTGRSSDRKNHTASYNFLMQRNADETAKETQKGKA